MSVLYEHRAMVLRNSTDEITFAEVNCMTTDKNMTDGKLRDKISQAVLKWRETTKEGDTAWEYSCEDFNVGDLAAGSLGDENLKKELEKVGVYELEIKTHSFDLYGCTEWRYDEVLGK